VCTGKHAADQEQEASMQQMFQQQQGTTEDASGPRSGRHISSTFFQKKETEKLSHQHQPA
jgi:hypothetical protein